MRRCTDTYHYARSFISIVLVCPSQRMRRVVTVLHLPCALIAVDAVLAAPHEPSLGEI
jgi:hypothetical protein